MTTDQALAILVRFKLSGEAAGNNTISFGHAGTVRVNAYVSPKELEAIAVLARASGKQATS